MSLASEAHFGDYNPADFGWGSRDPRNNSKLLSPFSYKGVSFGSMHVDVHGLFTALLDELYPHIPGGLVAGQCGCYNPNSVTVGGQRSFHTYGTAIDINWGSNPMNDGNIPAGPHVLPPITGTIAHSFGCEWGGNWSDPKDHMHIEVHLTPAVARTVQPSEEFTMDADAKKAFNALQTQINALSAKVAAIPSDTIRTTFKIWNGSKPNTEALLSNIHEVVHAILADEGKKVSDVVEPDTSVEVPGAQNDADVPSSPIFDDVEGDTGTDPTTSGDTESADDKEAEATK